MRVRVESKHEYKLQSSPKQLDLKYDDLDIKEYAICTGEDYIHM